MDDAGLGRHAHIIRRSGLMEHFPESTPTDLYLYAMDYLHKLRETWGTTTGDAEDAVEDLVEISRPEDWLDRLRLWWEHLRPREDRDREE